MNLRKLIHNLLKALEWETVDQVRIAGVWPLRKNKPDRPFDDRLSVARCYFSHLNDLLTMKGEEGVVVGGHAERDAQVLSSTSVAEVNVKARL
jgi:hypothetical protein